MGNISGKYFFGINWADYYRWVLNNGREEARPPAMKECSPSTISKDSPNVYASIQVQLDSTGQYIDT